MSESIKVINEKIIISNEGHALLGRCFKMFCLIKPSFTLSLGGALPSSHQNLCAARMSLAFSHYNEFYKSNSRAKELSEFHMDAAIIPSLHSKHAH